MLPYTFNDLRHHLISALNLQLFITLISLPVCIAWGLPLSAFTLIGNLLFPPMLTAYIFVSSLLFITSLCSIPNSALCWVLDQLTTIWLCVFSMIPPAPYIGFPYHSLVLTSFPAIAAIAILHSQRYVPNMKTILYSAVLLIMILGSLVYQRLHNTIVAIPCFDQTISAIITHNQCILVDPGYIGRRISAPSWAEYKLLPALTKETGRTTIDHLIVMQPTSTTFAALTVLAQKKAVKCIYVPYWQSAEDSTLPSAFTACKAICEQQNIAIVRFGQQTTIPIILDSSVMLRTDTQWIRRGNGTRFVAAQIVGMIDNKPFSFYASQCKKQKTRCI